MAMDAECSQLLPHVCKILVDGQQHMTDDSIYEKLLDWFRSLLCAAPPEVILAENPCIVGLVEQVLGAEEPDPSLLAFSMRVVGMFSAQPGGFHYLQAKNVVHGMFGERGFSSVSWKDASVRRAWIQGLLSMLQHKQALHFFHHNGLMDVMLDLLMDSSMFVASAVNGLVAHVFLTSVALDGQPAGSCGSVTELPSMALTIFTHLEKLLLSGASVTQSLKALTAIFESCSDLLAELLWPPVSELLNALLDQKPVPESRHMEGLLLSVARFPFCREEHDVWMVIKRTLRDLNPLQASSLAFGILMLEQSPQEVRLQAVCVLFHPLDYVLRTSADPESPEKPGLFDEPVCDPLAVELLLSGKSSCIGLLCQCLGHLTELSSKGSLPAQIPHGSVLHAVVLLLQYSMGQLACSSPRGGQLCRFLIGSLRVQRSALDALGALSVWPLRLTDCKKSHGVLNLYLENSETDPTVLKKSFQASLKWICSSGADAEHREETRHFLLGLCPVMMKRLCSPCWEVRDHALEFLTNLMDATKEHRECLQVLNSSSSLLQLVADLLKDPESYVRASAVTCLGRIADIMDLYPTAIVSCPTSVESWKLDLVSSLLAILCQDSEGFPRRAVVAVFSDWLRKGHMVSQYEGKPLLPRLLEITLGDLDWEVKLNAVELVNVYITQTLHISPSCPYTADLPLSKRAFSLADVTRQCEDLGLFQFLFGCLCDCDRPVALKACELLLSLRPVLCEGSRGAPDIRYGRDWLEGFLQHPGAHASNGSAEGGPAWVTDILGKIDLDNMKLSLSQSSGYLHETPLSLLQDIRASLRGGEEQDADCY